MTEKLNLVIDYIENHITEDIEQAEIAKVACCSYYDVGRMFSLLANITISDYIRKRRLTLAGFELKYNNLKVIDATLKYKYESPTSFARAFSSFHGFNPGEAQNENNILKVFPRLIYKIEVRGVMDPLKTDLIEIDGKKYKASYYGEADMSAWSSIYAKRQYWRVENAYEDFKRNQKTSQVLPYNNYPPINIEIGQTFFIDYFRFDGGVERKYYVADGTNWHGMTCTSEVLLEYIKPLRVDEICICGKIYDAEYLGEYDISEWSNFATKREFWKIRNFELANVEFENDRDVLPYNNYPPVKINLGDVFIIDYHTNNVQVERRFYVADGTVWNEMESTRRILLK